VWISRTITVFLLALGPTLVQADQRQFGNIVYSPLPGWTSGRDDGGQLVFLSDLPNDLCQYCYIHLSNSKPGRGSVEMYLNRENLLFVDDDDRDSVTVISPPSKITLAGYDGAMQALKIGSNIQIVIAISLGDRFEMFGFQGGAYDDADLAESMSVFQTQVVPFFERIAFVSAGAQPLMPKPQSGDLDGIWWGWSTYTTFGLDMMMRQEMDYRTLVFWPDGYFYDGTPPAGLALMDPVALQDNADPDFGVYLHTGNTLTLTYATGEVEVLMADGNAWSDDQKTLTQVAPLPDGAVLNGGISSFFYTGFTPGAGLEGGISSSSSTEFFPNGTYQGQSFGGAFANFTAGGGFTTGNEGATGGTYAIKDGLVISTPANGDAPTAALALKLDDDTILIGNQFLETGK
jgi:hypothetical protein